MGALCLMRDNMRKGLKYLIRMLVLPETFCISFSKTNLVQIFKITCVQAPYVHYCKVIECLVIAVNDLVLYGVN